MVSSRSLNLKLASTFMLALFSMGQCGCLLTAAHHAIPVKQVPESVLMGNRSGMVNVSPALLEQHVPTSHIIGPGDVLSVYIQGVLPPNMQDSPIMQNQASLNSDYYPPNGSLRTPSYGVPIEVDEEGNLTLPLVGRLRVSGLTIPEVDKLVREKYIYQQIINRDREKMYISLARPRVYRVTVIREDTSALQPQILAEPSIEYTKRGSSKVVDLPAFENDVLHALSASGGMPGTDAENEVWVIRGNAEQVTHVQAAIESGNASDETLAQMCELGAALRIPLRIAPGEVAPFGPHDVILNDGDIVYVPTRNEYFYTAGLLVGGKIPLPRDDDLDILEAIALASGSVGGPGNGNTSIFRSGGLGNVVPPSRAVVIRKLPNGQQLPIRVDLSKAVRDVQERVIIKPDDVIYLHYKGKELVGNMVLNFLNFNFLVDTGNF